MDLDGALNGAEWTWSSEWKKRCYNLSPNSKIFGLFWREFKRAGAKCGRVLMLSVHHVFKLAFEIELHFVRGFRYFVVLKLYLLFQFWRFNYLNKQFLSVVPKAPRRTRRARPIIQFESFKVWISSDFGVMTVCYTICSIAICNS